MHAGTHTSTYTYNWKQRSKCNRRTEIRRVICNFSLTEQFWTLILCQNFSMDPLLFKQTHEWESPGVDTGEEGWRATLNTWSPQMHRAFVWQCHVRRCQDLAHFRWSNESQHPSLSRLFPIQCLHCTAGISKPWNPPGQMPDSAVSDSKITHPKCHWLKPSLGAHPKVQRVRNKSGVLFIDGHVNYEFDF